MNKQIQIEKMYTNNKEKLKKLEIEKQYLQDSLKMYEKSIAIHEKIVEFKHQTATKLYDEIDRKNFIYKLLLKKRLLVKRQEIIDSHLKKFGLTKDTNFKGATTYNLNALKKVKKITENALIQTEQEIQKNINAFNIALCECKSFHKVLINSLTKNVGILNESIILKNTAESQISIYNQNDDFIISVDSNNFNYSCGELSFQKNTKIKFVPLYKEEEENINTNHVILDDDLQNAYIYNADCVILKNDEEGNILVLDTNGEDILGNIPKEYTLRMK